MDSKTADFEEKHSSSVHDPESKGTHELQHGVHPPERRGFARFYYNPVVQVTMLGFILFM
jgi:hypothetical protein